MKIHTNCETFEIQPAAELPKPLTFPTTEVALNWLTRLSSQDSDLMSQMRQCLARCSSESPETFRLDDHRTLEKLANLLYSRRLVVFRKQQSASSGTPRKKAEELAPAFPLSERRGRGYTTWKPSNTWISIELKNSNGKAMAGEDYKIELPDGQVVEGKLDGMGTAEVSGIDPGQCKVTFPRLAGSTWDLAAARPV